MGKARVPVGARGFRAGPSVSDLLSRKVFESKSLFIKISVPVVSAPFPSIQRKIGRDPVDEEEGTKAVPTSLSQFSPFPQSRFLCLQGRRPGAHLLLGARLCDGGPSSPGLIVD